MEPGPDSMQQAPVWVPEPELGYEDYLLVEQVMNHASPPSMGFQISRAWKAQVQRGIVPCMPSTAMSVVVCGGADQARCLVSASARFFALWAFIPYRANLVPRVL